MSNQYLQAILDREAVNVGIFSPVRNAAAQLNPVIRRWAGIHLIGWSPSGSFAKGTANQSGTDIDLFISLAESTPDTLANVFATLEVALRSAGYAPRRQNVSINVTASGYSVDLVPGKRQNAFSGDHSLFKSKTGSWTKTNISTHIGTVTGAGRQSATRILKLWRNQKGLDLPSFYLELTVIQALQGQIFIDLKTQVARSLGYIRDHFMTARVVDPANGNNVISDDLSVAEKRVIANAAATALNGPWTEVVR